MIKLVAQSAVVEKNNQKKKQKQDESSNEMMDQTRCLDLDCSEVKHVITNYQ